MYRLPLLVTVAAFVGCSGPATVQKPPATSTVPVELTPVSAAGLERAIAEQKGKVVLVDVWFLGCTPCREKFPHVVELHRKYAADGLAVMSVDMIPDELDRKEKIVDFLKKNDAGFPNFILADQASSDSWTDKIGLRFTPYTLMYDRAGNRIPIRGDATMEEIEVAVRTALASR